MTLTEALKTGRNFRQKSGSIHGCHHWMKLPNVKMFSTSEVLADDWEVEPEVYTVESNLICTNYVPGEISSCAFFADSKTTDKIHGKRTKLTIEVLPE